MPIAAKTEFMSFLSAALGIKGEQDWLRFFQFQQLNLLVKPSGISRKLSV